MRRTWIRPVPEFPRKSTVPQEVLNVCHLVVHRDQVLHGDLGTHLDPAREAEPIKTYTRGSQLSRRVKTRLIRTPSSYL